ncbi:alpha/beta hydrolase [Candidatus Woesearchaeota archaeon]|nr:alpha/beta hydrolase [Candidatus Woesearchaeota archaeon]
MQHHVMTVGQNRIKYQTTGKGEPLLFLHGYGNRLFHFSRLFEKIHEKMNCEIIAPEMYGINYLKNQPTTITGYAELTSDFLSKLKIKEHNQIGYSIGAAVGFFLGNEPNVQKIVGISPPVKVEENLVKYMLSRGSIIIKKNLDAKFYFVNSLKKPITTLRISIETKNVDYADHDLIEKPTLILYAENDEFCQMNDSGKQQLERIFNNLEIRMMPQRKHTWIIDEPELAAKEITDFLNQKDIFIN